MNFRTVKNHFRAGGMRGLGALFYAEVCNKTALVKTAVPGSDYPMFLRAGTSDMMIFRQVFREMPFDFPVRKEPAVIVDGGANVGVASVFFANRFPAARIYSIEPESRNFALLKKNAAPYQNIIPIQGGLWNENKELAVVDAARGTIDETWGYKTWDDSGPENPPAEVIHRVRGMTVDQVMKSRQIKFVDILKIDIEGAEREVFSAPQAWIGKVGGIIIELHELYKSGCNRTFYNATSDFDDEWMCGEYVYCVRNTGCIARPGRPV